MKRALVVLLLSAAAAACTGSNAARTASPDTRAQDRGDPSISGAQSGAAITGGGLSVEEARASTLDGVLLVRGYLVKQGGQLLLCSALGEGSRSCGGASLVVRGAIDGLRGEAQPVSLLGRVHGGELTVSTTSR